jgi:hypothetical protein
MPIGPNPWGDVDDVSDRQPAYCPYCGESPAFGGLGRTKNGYKHHCPECGNKFITILPDTDE